VSVSGARADVRLPGIFSDHMVLQSNAAAPVWGWADPGEEVTVAIGGQSQKTKAGADGKWRVKLEPLKTGESLTLTVQGKNTLTVNDVLAGEVWLCAGQSNMGFSLGRAAHGAEEAAAAHFPQIRLFVVRQAGALEPRDDTTGKWEVCSPSVAIRSSAVAFLFARGLFQELKVPIGIIHSSVGGTPIENWISREVLDTVSGYKEIAAAKLGLMQSQAGDAKKFPAERDRWDESNGVKPPENQGVAKGWADPAFDDHDWKTIALPAKWADSLGVKQGGVFWLRKEITFPKELAGRSVSLNLNYMHEQYDTTYFNGVEVGHTGDQPPYFYMGARIYDIPGKLVREGRNVIAVRVVAANPRADLMGRGARGDYNLPLDQKSVGNQWRCQVESLLPSLSSEALKSRPKVNTAALYDTPVVLFNAMIHPLIPYGIRGAVWYQGESNTTHPDDYQRLFPLLIEDWRRRWAQGDFPFYYVQIANFGDAPRDPNQKSGWATIREAQTATLQKEPNTGMAVIIDADDGQNMHPKNKLPVGERLTRLALARTYSRPMESAGPTYDSMSVEGNRVRIHFRHADELTSKDGAPKWFAIAGQDRQFVWGEARIEGDSIVVSSPHVGQPVAVRYCWADDPVGCNVYNAAGLPAGPFRTDDWPSPSATGTISPAPAPAGR
jgi:sialate O-acetylesterase